MRVDEESNSLCDVDLGGSCRLPQMHKARLLGSLRPTKAGPSATGTAWSDRAS